MNRTWRIRFREKPIFDLVKSGVKTIETRALNPDEPERYFGAIKEGDILECEFVNSGEVILKVVCDTRVYKDLEGYLKKENLDSVFGKKTTKAEARKIHLSFPGYEQRLKDYGIVAIEMEELPLRYGDVTDIEKYLESDFFDSLRADYPGFDTWFKEKCVNGNRPCYFLEDGKNLKAILIMNEEPKVAHNLKDVLQDVAKFCTFKVAEELRGGAVAKSLLLAGELWAKEKNLTTVYLTISRNSKSNQERTTHFLKNNGFEVTQSLDAALNQKEEIYLKKI